MKNWNQDNFTQKARKEGYLARSIYKLEEIDQKYQVIPFQKKILDLGGAPGSWVQYCLKKKQALEIVGIDLKPLSVQHKRVIGIEGDIYAEESKAQLLSHAPFDVVLSDMAPYTTGMAIVDQEESHKLATLALELCQSYLAEGGSFVVKYFMGPELTTFKKKVKQHFGEVYSLRPQSTRKHSKEIFVIGKKHTK